MSIGIWEHINIWPDELINLNLETQHHPVLMSRLANHPPDQWEVKITEIANYCEVIVDGDYMPEQMVQLAGILHKKLIERREDNRGLVVITTVQ